MYSDEESSYEGSFVSSFYKRARPVEVTSGESSRDRLEATGLVYPPCNESVTSEVLPSSAVNGGDRVSSARVSIEEPMAVPETQSNRRARGYCITVNNPSDEEYDDLLSWVRSGVSCTPVEITYAIVGKEVGVEGTPHIQGYLYFKNAKTWSAVKKYPPLRRAHLEVAKGDPTSNQKYCSKEGNFVEEGSLPEKGKRSDLDVVAEMISEGSSMSDVAKSHPVQFIKYSKGIMALKSLMHQPRKEKTVVHWYYGPTGTGKSHRAREVATAAGSWYYKDPTTKWWDGYDQQQVVIVEDYRRDFCTFASLLRLLDEYELKVEYKGGYVDFNSKIIIFTTPKSPRDTWENQTQEQLSQLLRRIEFVEHFIFPFRK